MESNTKLSFIAEITKALAWPVTFFIILIVFYPQIAEKLVKLKTVESKGITYNWGNTEATNNRLYPLFSMNFRTIEQMQIESCIADAEKALKTSGFVNIVCKDSGLVWGYNEEYTGAVICRYENDVAAFIVSGPTLEKSIMFRRAMEKEFGTPER